MGAGRQALPPVPMVRCSIDAIVEMDRSAIALSGLEIRTLKRRPTGLSFSGTRRKFLQAAAAIGATGALAMVGDGAIFEANRPELVSLEIPLPRLGASWDGVRIVQL